MNTKTAVLFAAIVHCISAHNEGLCAGLKNQMQQHCSPPDIIEGPRGETGPQGPPGKVNYTLVQEKIEELYGKFKTEIELQEERWQNKFHSLLTGCENITKGFASSWHGTGGIFHIYPESFPGGVQVYCDLTSDGGGWNVFQRRMDGSVDFYRGWNDYVRGFGDKDKEFWLGLETIYQLTKDGDYELRVDIGDWEGESRYAQYGTFSIAGSDDNYRLTVGDYSGTAGDSLEYHNNNQFSTKDRDNDGWPNGNCAVDWTGGWWYKKCHVTNLNGIYHKGGSGATNKNVVWREWKGIDYSLKTTELKFRKKHI